MMGQGDRGIGESYSGLAVIRASSGMAGGEGWKDSCAHRKHTLYLNQMKACVLMLLLGEDFLR